MRSSFSVSAGCWLAYKLPLHMSSNSRTSAPVRRSRRVRGLPAPGLAPPHAFLVGEVMLNAAQRRPVDRFNGLHFQHLMLDLDFKGV